MCASIVAKLLGSGVPNTVVLSTIENLQEFLEDLQSDIQNQILNSIPENNTCRSAIEEVFKSLENPFGQLNSDTKWQKYFKDEWGIVQSVELHLGVRYDTRQNKTGNYEQVPVNDKFIYVPILKTFQFIFRNEDICEMMQTLTQSDVYEDFCDGSYFKSHPLFSVHRFSLQIQLFYDDFECANPLGSKKGIHKVGCLYFILRNLFQS